jgi:hypothetical protein
MMPGGVYPWRRWLWFDPGDDIGYGLSLATLAEVCPLL